MAHALAKPEVNTGVSTSAPSGPFPPCPQKPILALFRTQCLSGVSTGNACTYMLQRQCTRSNAETTAVTSSENTVSQATWYCVNCVVLRLLGYSLLQKSKRSDQGADLGAGVESMAQGPSRLTTRAEGTAESALEAQSLGGGQTPATRKSQTNEMSRQEQQG